MKIKNIRIGTQLITGFSIILIFVIILGCAAYRQMFLLHRETKTMYDHPLQVRRALGILQTDIMMIRASIGDLIIADDDRLKLAAIQQIEASNADSLKHFDIISDLYLGPASDVDSAYDAFIKWKAVVNETVRFTQSGETQKAVENIQPGGSLYENASIMTAAIQKIDTFSVNKANSLYSNSVILSRTLNTQLIIIIISILILSILISYLILHQILRPLTEMKRTVQRFHQGEMDARSGYESKNEFGVLSSSINELAERVQKDIILNTKTVKISEVMLSEEDDRKFFRLILESLAEHTGSQVAAAYILNTGNRTFEYFESIGADDRAKKSFSADDFEGELGAALLTKKIQHIKNIPEDTRFVFQTVNGRFIPKEIMTIPISTNSHVTAIISLASLHEFSELSIELINEIKVAMSTRIEGIFAYRKIRQFRDALEKQNKELDIQKNELTSQASELVQQNTELEMQKNQLSEVSRLKTNFLSNMSHELRTPLNSVIALSGVLSRRLVNKIPDDEYNYLKIIERNGLNLLDLINDVLDISRIEANREEVEPVKFNVNDVLDEIIAVLEPLAEQKNIRLLNDSKDSLINITSDVDKVRHILQNLVGNAVKFTEKGGVAVSAEQKEDKIEVKIIDSGIGISPESLSLIFEEFRQADGSTSRRFGGTGLGLAIAKKYANLLGGEISVQSTIDVGSEFTLSLPLRYDAKNRIIDENAVVDFRYDNMQPHQPTLQPQPVISESDKTILLVDDNESAIIQIRDLIEEMGYKILVAQDGGKALEIISHTIPDAIILDLMMPGIDGFKVLEILRNAETTSHIPVLVLTAKHITNEEMKLLKRNNVHQLIQKGDADRKKLQNAISNILFPERTVVKENLDKTRPAKVRPPERKPVILVVEDNPDNMTTVKALLEEKYTVLEAIDGNEGVEMAGKYFPDLVLMDIALSGTDGIQAFNEIRNNPKLQHIPVIALTASAMINDRETILSHGFNAYIAKPIIAEDFFEGIDEVLYGK